MRKIYLLSFCLVVSLFVVTTNAYGITVNDSEVVEVNASDLWPSGIVGEHIIVNAGGKLTINGDVTQFSTKNLIVEEGGVLIINGSLFKSQLGSSSYVKGNLIVIGNYIGNNLDIEESANVVVGGDVMIVGRKTEFSEESDFYAINDDTPTIIGTADITTEDIGNVTDLITDMGGDPDLGDLIQNVIVDENSDKTWDGSDSEDWTDDSNWDLGEPSLFDNVIIDDGNFQPAIENSKCLAGNLTLKTGAKIIIKSGREFVVLGDLTINTGATLTLEAGCIVSIAGNLTNLGNLEINNTSSSPSSIIIQGSASGNITYNWNWGSSEYLTWWYMSHPVSGVKVQQYKDCVGAAADQNGDGVADGNDFRTYVYDVNVPGWVNKTSYVSYSFSAMEAIGFKVKNPSSVLTYTGELNADESYPFNASAAGVYHKVGNPYSSYIDLEAIDYGSFSPTTYIYEASSNSYLTYNGSTSDASPGASRYIAPGQSFWIYANNATDVLAVTKSLVCVHPDVPIGLKSASSTVETNKLRLKITNANTNDEVLVAFRDYGSNEFTNYDSRKYMVGGKSGNFYTIKDNVYTIFNSLPQIQGNEIIPLGYKVSEAGMTDFTIQVNDLSGFNPSASVYLEDKEKGIFIDLRNEREYTFTPTVAQSDDRFVIRIEEQLTTDIKDDKQTVVEEDILIYSINKKVIVRVSDDVLQKPNQNQIIEIYNISGGLIERVEIQNNETIIKLPNTNSTSIYIIKVVIDEFSIQQKVIS